MGEMTTWLHAADTRRLISEIREEVACLTLSDPMLDKRAQALLDQLAEQVDWFVAAAEERDRLRPPRCCDCGKAVQSGTGLEKAGILTPLCSGCTGHRAFSEGVAHEHP